MNDSTKLSAIWICECEDKDVCDTLSAYLTTLSSLPCQCELIMVSSGTLDTEPELLSALQASTVPCTVICLHRNTEHSTAIAAALDASHSELVALLPSYLQSDPSELGQMLNEVEHGSDYVASWRSPRIDSRLGRLKSRIFNSVTRSLTRVRLHDINSELRLMKREITRDVPLYSELDRFLPILAEMQGYRVSEIKVRHLAEKVKRGDGGLSVYFRRILDVMTLFFLFKFTRKPLRFFGLLGGSTVLLGTAILSVVVVQRLMGTAAADRPALPIAVLLIVLGVQLFSLGLLGELIIFVHGSKFGTHQVEKVFESNDK